MTPLDYGLMGARASRLYGQQDDRPQQASDRIALRRQQIQDRIAQRFNPGLQQPAAPALQPREQRLPEPPPQMTPQPELPEESFGMKSLGAIGNFLDVPGSMIRDVVTLNNPFDQLLSPFSAKNRTSGEDIRKSLGILPNDSDSTAGMLGRFGLDLGIEIALDPLTYTPLGAVAAMKGAGKGAKAARSLKRAGLLDDVAEVASKKLGRKVGPREALQHVSAEDVIKFNRQTTAAGAREAVAKRSKDFEGALQRDIKKVAQDKRAEVTDAVKKAKLSEGYARFRLPYGLVDVSFGGEKTARAMDALGEGLRFSKPVRAGNMLLNKKMKGRITKKGQIAAEQESKELLENRAVARGRLAGPMLGITAALGDQISRVDEERIGSLMYEYLEDVGREGLEVARGVDPDTGKNVVTGKSFSEAASSFANRDKFAELRERGLIEHLDVIKEEYGKALETAQKSGVPVEMLDDEFISYAARDRNPAETPFGRADQASGYEVKTANATKRRDYLRGLPGGTSLLQKMSLNIDPATGNKLLPDEGGIAASLDTAKEAGEKVGKAVTERRKQKFAEVYGVPEDKVDKLYSLMANRPFKEVAEGKPLFVADPSQAAMSSIQSLYEASGEATGLSKFLKDNVQLRDTAELQRLKSEAQDSNFVKTTDDQDIATSGLNVFADFIYNNLKAAADPLRRVTIRNVDDGTDAARARPPKGKDPKGKDPKGKSPDSKAPTGKDPAGKSTGSGSRTGKKPDPKAPTSQRDGDDFEKGLELLANLDGMGDELFSEGYEDLIRRLSDSSSDVERDLATKILRERPDIADETLRLSSGAAEPSEDLASQLAAIVNGMKKAELDETIRSLKERNPEKYASLKLGGRGIGNEYKRQQITKAITNGDMEFTDGSLRVRKADTAEATESVAQSVSAGTIEEQVEALDKLTKKQLDVRLKILATQYPEKYGAIEREGATAEFMRAEVAKAISNGDMTLKDKQLRVKAVRRPGSAAKQEPRRRQEPAKQEPAKQELEALSAEEQISDVNANVADSLAALGTPEAVRLAEKIRSGDVSFDSPAIRDLAEASTDLADDVAESAGDVEEILSGYRPAQLNTKVQILKTQYPEKYKGLKKISPGRNRAAVTADLLKAFKDGDIEFVDDKLRVKVAKKSEKASESKAPRAPAQSTQAAQPASVLGEKEASGLIDKLSSKQVDLRLKKLRELHPDKYGSIKLSGKGVTNKSKKEQLLGFAGSGDFVLVKGKLLVADPSKEAAVSATAKVLSPEESVKRGRKLISKMQRKGLNNQIRNLRKEHGVKYGSGTLRREVVSDLDAKSLLETALENGDLRVDDKGRLTVPRKDTGGALPTAEELIEQGSQTRVSQEEYLAALRSSGDPAMLDLADKMEELATGVSQYAGKETVPTEDDVRFAMLLEMLPEYNGAPVESFRGLLKALNKGEKRHKLLAKRLRYKFRSQSLDDLEESVEALETGLRAVEDFFLEELEAHGLRFVAMETDDLPKVSYEMVTALFRRGDAKGYALAEKIVDLHSSNEAMRELGEKYATIKPGSGRSIARKDGQLNKKQKTLIEQKKASDAAAIRAAEKKLGRAERSPRLGDSLAHQYRLYTYTGKLPTDYNPEDARKIIQRRIEELELMKRAGYSDFSDGRPLDRNAVEAELDDLKGRFGGAYRPPGRRGSSEAEMVGPTTHLFSPEELARMASPDSDVGKRVSWERGMNGNARKPKLLVDLAKKVLKRVEESGTPSERKRMGRAAGGVSANRNLLMEVYNKEPMKEVADLIEDLKEKLTTGAKMTDDEHEAALAFIVNDELPHGIGHFADVPEEVKAPLRITGKPGKPGVDPPPSVAAAAKAVPTEIEGAVDALTTIYSNINKGLISGEDLEKVAEKLGMEVDDLVTTATDHFMKSQGETFEQTSRYYGGIAGARIGLSDQSFFADVAKRALGEGYLSAYGSAARDIAAALQEARRPGQKLADAFASNHPSLEEIKIAAANQGSTQELMSALKRYDDLVDSLNEAASAIVDDETIAEIVRDTGVAMPAAARKGTKSFQEYFTGLADQMLQRGNPVHASRLRAIGNPLSDSSGRMLGSGRYEDYEFPELIGKFANGARRVSYQDEYGFNSIEALLSARPEIFREMVADAQSLIGRDTTINFGHAAAPYSKLPANLIDSKGIARAASEPAESAASKALRQLDTRSPGSVVTAGEVLDPASNALGMSAEEIRFLRLPELFAESAQITARELADYIDDVQPNVTVRYRDSIDPSSNKFISTDADDYLEMHVDVAGDPVHLRSKVEDADGGAKILSIQEAQGINSGPALEAGIRTAINTASENGIDGVRVAPEAAPELERIAAEVPGLEFVPREDGSAAVMISAEHRQARRAQGETLFQAGDSDEKLAKITIPGPDQEKWFENHLRTHIEAFKKADARSLMHELGHLMRKTMRALGDNKLEQLQDMMRKYVREPGTETLPDGSFNWKAMATRPDGTVPDTGKYDLEEAFADIVMDHMTNKARAASSVTDEDPGIIRSAVAMFKDYLGATYSRVKQAPEAEEITDEITSFLDEVIGEENYYMRRPGNTAQFLDALKFGSVRLMNRVANDLGSENVERAEEVVIKKRLDDIKMATDDFTSIEEDRYSRVMEEYRSRKERVVDEFEAANGRKPTHFEVPDLMRKDGEFEGIDMGVSLKDALSQFEIDKKYAEDIQRVMTNGQALAKFANSSRFIQLIDGIQNTFKTNVTATNPGFHGRNLISGIFQNILNDITDPDARGFNKFFKPYRDARTVMLGREITGLADSAPVLGFVKGQDKEATTELVRLAYAHGVLESPSQQYDLIGASGQFVSDILPTGAAESSGNAKGLLDLIKQKGKKNSPAKRTESFNMFKVAGGFAGDEKFALARYGRAAGDVTEGLHRLGGFTALIKQGYSPAEAAKRIKLLHVDYTNLSEVERQVLRRIFPFYSYSRGMTEYLVRELSERPAGKVGQSIRAANVTRKKDPAMPDYVASGLSIPVGVKPDGTKTYISGLGLMHEQPVQLLDPIVSLNPQEALFEIGSNLSPLIKGPLEVMFNESLFQQSPQGGRSLDDLDPLVGRTLSNVGNTLGLTDRTEPYNIGKIPEAVVSNSPVSRYLSTVRTVTDPRKTVAQKLSPFGTGARFSTISPAAQDAVLRERATQLMRELGGKVFERSYIPQEVMDSMSPDEREKAEQYMTLMKMLGDRAKQRKAILEMQADQETN